MERDKDINYKKYIFIGILIIAISILIIFIINNSNSSSTYIILDNEVIKYEDGLYNKVDFEESIDKSFRIILDNQYLGNYYSDHYDFESELIFFKYDDQSYVFKDSIIGIQNNVDYIEYEKINFDKTDLDLLNSIYDGNSFKDLKEFTEASKVIIDLDDNGIDDIIYNATYELDNEYIYSIIFVNLNGNIQILDEDQGYDEGPRVVNTVFRLEYIIDVSKDKEYELVISKYNSDVPSYSIYSLENEYVESYFSGFGW